MRFSKFSSRSFSLRSRKNTHDGSGHQVCHGACEHGADAESCELAALLRRKRADAADLDTDGAEVSEAAESEGGDGESARIERAFHGAKLAKRDKFIDHHARPEQVADLCRVMPGHADQPRHRREDPAENSLQAFRAPGHVKPLLI